jgi:hypothetical protein
MTYVQSNNPISRKTSPLRVDPFAKKKDEATVISPGVVSIKDPAAGSTSMHEGEKPIELVGQPMPAKEYEELADMEEAGVDQPDYEDENRKPGEDTVQGRMAGVSRKASPLNDSYIKQEEKMIKRNQEKGNQFQQASAGSKTQRIGNAVGAAQALNAINESEKTINLLKSTGY